MPGFGHRVQDFVSQFARRLLMRRNLSESTSLIAPSKASPFTTVSRPIRTTLATYRPDWAESTSSDCTILSNPSVQCRVSEEIIHIIQSSNGPGNLLKSRAGRSLRCARSVCGNLSNTIGPMHFTRMLPSSQQRCRRENSRPACHAWQTRGIGLTSLFPPTGLLHASSLPEGT